MVVTQISPFSINLFKTYFSKCLVKKQPCTEQTHVSTTLSKKLLKNIEGKGENAGSRHFPHCSTLFFTLQRQLLLLEILMICGL